MDGLQEYKYRFLCVVIFFLKVVKSTSESSSDVDFTTFKVLYYNIPVGLELLQKSVKVKSSQGWDLMTNSQKMKTDLLLLESEKKAASSLRDMYVIF